MKNLILFSLLLTTVFFGCSDSSEEAKTSNAVAEFEIEGMVCEMGCGATLRKGLFETGYVTEVEVDYSEENPSNSIKVFFNQDNISTDKIEEIIESLNENQFEASLISTKELSLSEKQKYEENESNSTLSHSGVEASTKSFSFPNITELLNSLIH